MMKPFRLLDDSLKQFVFGLVPGFAMAFVCLALQVALWSAFAYLENALFTPAPIERVLDDRGWRAAAAELLFYGAMAVAFFAHALVALVLTAWLLRRRAGFVAARVLRRAARGAAIVTVVAAVFSIVAFLFDDVMPATRNLRVNFHALAMLALWFGGTALLLPARLMGHEPVASDGLRRTTFVAALALLPYLFVSEIVGGPLRRCHECWGFFEGGLFTIPLLGAYLLGLTVSSAAFSAAACMPKGGRTEAPNPAVA